MADMQDNKRTQSPLGRENLQSGHKNKHELHKLREFAKRGRIKRTQMAQKAQTAKSAQMQIDERTQSNRLRSDNADAKRAKKRREWA